MTRTIFIIFLSLLNLSARAQSSYILKGRVVDEKENALDLAQVRLTAAWDSTMFFSKFSDIDGSFEISVSNTGSYHTEIQYLGFNVHKIKISFSENEPIQDLGTIKLTASSQTLQAVTVTSKKPYIERKIDRTIVNVDALIANTGSSVFEALERAPGISIDPNGNIIMRARSGVLVYIDDKPTYLSGSELENYLKSLPAGTIKQIEIMTNPPAKYEAAGNAGVINIITKRNKIAGMQGNVVLSALQGRYTRSNNSLNVNYNQSKLSAFVNINGGFRNSFQDLNINRYYKESNNTLASSFSQNSFIEKNGRSINTKAGLDYYFSKKTTIGFSAKAIFSPNGDVTDNKALLSDRSNMLTGKVNADNVTNNTFNNATYNTYLRLNLDTIGSNLTFDADYVVYNATSSQLFKNFILTPQNVLTYQDQIDGNIPSTIKIYAAKTDYIKSFINGSRFEAGLKSAYTKTDNEAIYNTTIDQITLPNYDLSNRFIYDEWIQAAYLNYATRWKKLDVQVGLRGEATTLKGHQLGNIEKPDTSFTRNYLNLFPTLFVSMPLDSAGIHTLNLTYGRRIDRPYFQDLNPFISPLDKFTFYSGNPNLLPTYANNISLTHSYKSTINTSLNYSKTIDGINETLEIKEGIYYSRPGNIATNQSISLSMDAAIPITKRYHLNSYVESGYLEYKSALYTETLNSSGYYLAASVTNSFQLGKSWSADLRADYQSDIIYAQLLIKSFGTLNVGFQKKLFNNKANLKVNFNDILYTRRADGIINNLKNTDADWNSRLDTRSAAISFSYQFGSSKFNRQKHSGSGSESEQNRVKT